MMILGTAIAAAPPLGPQIPTPALRLSDTREKMECCAKADDDTPAAPHSGPNP